MITTWTLKEVVKFLLEKFNDNKEIKLTSLIPNDLSRYENKWVIYLKIFFTNDILWDISSIVEVDSYEKETDNSKVITCNVFLEDKNYRIYWSH